MRYVALVMVALSLPIFVAWLRSRPQHRHHALAALVFMLFVGGQLQVGAALISWPLWSGLARGIQISLVDTLAIALILTRRNGIDRLPFLMLIGLYLACMALSLVNSSVALATVFACVQFLRTALVFVAVGGEFTRPRALPAVLTGLALGLLLQAGFVIWQKLGGVVQATGTMAHQNLLGVAVELALIPLAAAVLEKDRRGLIVAGVVAGLVVVAGGGSRGAIGIIAVGLAALVILALVRRPTARKFKMVGLGAVVLVAVAPLGWDTLRDRFGDTPITSEEDQRAAFERAARAMAADYPLGVGANMYVTVNNLEGYADAADVSWIRANRSAPVHNAYLLARAETGRAGEIAFILLLVVPLMGGIALAFRDRLTPAYGVVLGSSVAIGAVAFHNFYEFAVHSYHPQALLMLNIAIIAGHIRLRRLSNRGRHRMAAPTTPLLERTMTPAKPVAGGAQGRRERVTPASFFPMSGAQGDGASERDG